MKTRRHWQWCRTQGFSRLIEEDQLDPFTEIPNAVRKWRWRRANGVAPGTAIPVYVVGVQRSGTNMLVRGFERSPEFEVHNENDRRVFDGFRLRPDPVIRAVIEASRHRYVLFKPLCDSHRTGELLDAMGTGGRGRAIWAYRAVDGRASSALAKFGDANHRVLRAIAVGEATQAWQAQGLSEQSKALIGSFDYDRLSPASAAALFWYVRNSLYFELGLDKRDDVILSSYDMLVADPEHCVRALCGFLGFAWDPRLAVHVDRRSAVQPRLSIDTEIRRRCDELQERLDAAAEVNVRQYNQA